MNLKHSMLALSMMLAARFAPRKDIIVPDTGPNPPFGPADEPLPAANLAPEAENARDDEIEALRLKVKVRIWRDDVQPIRFGRNVVRALARQGRSTNTPHQSTRETARRLGGDDWQAYKAADRARRGLGG